MKETEYLSVTKVVDVNGLSKYIEMVLGKSDDRLSKEVLECYLRKFKRFQGRPHAWN